MRKKQWIWSPKRVRALPSAHEKEAIITACERLIADILKPRFLPCIRPTEFNYLVDLYGSWHGRRYRFIQRYRSGYPDNRGWEFEVPFTRLDFLAPDRFDVMWHRHTRRWWRLYHSVSLAEAFDDVEHDGLLHPL